MLASCLKLQPEMLRSNSGSYASWYTHRMPLSGHTYEKILQKLGTLQGDLTHEHPQHIHVLMPHCTTTALPILSSPTGQDSLYPPPGPPVQQGLVLHMVGLHRMQLEVRTAERNNCALRVCMPPEPVI